MPTLRLRVPDPLRLLIQSQGSDLSASQCIKQRLAEALSLVAGADPDLELPNPLLPATTCVVFLSKEQLAQIELLGKSRGISEPKVAEALVWMHAQDELARKINDDTVLESEPASRTLGEVNARVSGRQMRVDQAVFYRSLESFALTDRDGALFAEASTGVGKTYAFLVCALRWCAEHPEEIAVVAVPTYQVMEQTLKEWSSIATGGPVPASRAVVGQSGFVSSQALQSWIELSGPDEQQLAQDAAAWISNGAPPNPGGISEANWTSAGLQHACGGEFPDIADVLLGERSDDDDRGLAAYASQVKIKPAHAQGRPQLYFVTHSMLAVMVRERHRSHRASLGEVGQEHLDSVVAAWMDLPADQREQRLYELVNETLGQFGEDDAAKLPGIGLLIVDEAHELEKWFSMVSSLQVSVWSLVAELNHLRSSSPKLSASVVSRAQASFEKMRLLHNDDRTLPAATLSLVASEFCAVLKDALASVPKKVLQTPGARRIRAVTLMLDAALRPRALATRIPNAMRLRLEWSEGRHWPRLSVGRKDVSPMLDYLWRSVAAKSILVSATLYEDMPQVSAESIRQILAVPHSLAVEMSPVRPAWLFSPVTVFSASLTYRGDGYARFARPKRVDGCSKYELAYAAWIDEVSRYISQVWSQAAGGVLVLLTSYADLRAIQDGVGLIGGVGPMVVQVEGKPLSTAKQHFQQSVVVGSRPILMAVGSAWTGLDLSVRGFENALTDVVIPVAPFGMNRSVTQAEREARSPLAAAFAASFTLRQGCGRLVRDPNTPANRKIHFLDARRHADRARGMYAPINRWLAKYPNQVVV